MYTLPTIQNKYYGDNKPEVFNHAYMCSLNVAIKKNSSPDYIRQMITQISHAEIIFSTDIPLKRRLGKSSHKQSSGVDAGFARFTMLSSNFLDQLNLLLLEQ